MAGMELLKQNRLVFKGETIAGPRGFWPGWGNGWRKALVYAQISLFLKSWKGPAPHWSLTWTKATWWGKRLQADSHRAESRPGVRNVKGEVERMRSDTVLQ